jgi:hypothetical protein
LIALWNTTCNNDGFFDFLGFGDETEEGILGWVFDGAAVYEDEVCLIWCIDYAVSILDELSDHELAIRDIM